MLFNKKYDYELIVDGLDVENEHTGYIAGRVMGIVMGVVGYTDKSGITSYQYGYNDNGTFWYLFSTKPYVAERLVSIVKGGFFKDDIKVNLIRL